MNSIGKNLSLLLGPLASATIWWLQPAGLDVAQSKVLGVVSWMLIWWIAESVPMGVTSLLKRAWHTAIAMSFFFSVDFSLHSPWRNGIYIGV